MKERQRKKLGRAEERARRRAAVEQPARRRSNRQTWSSLSFSRAFSPSSSFRLYLSSCCFPSRTGPAVPEPHRVESKLPTCAWPKPPAVGLASGPLFFSSLRSCSLSPPLPLYLGVSEDPSLSPGPDLWPLVNSPAECFVYIAHHSQWQNFVFEKFNLFYFGYSSQYWFKIMHSYRGTQTYVKVCNKSNSIHF